MDTTEDERRDEQQEFLLKLLIVHQRQKILLAAVHCNAQHEKNRRLFVLFPSFTFPIRSASSVE
jgi:hypothetical protein